MNERYEKLKASVSEQESNFIHIHHALEKLTPYLPIGSEHLDDKDIVEHIDQMIFRFMKIQDGIGRRLIPLIVDAIEADTSEMTFIDKLNRLEKFGLMEPGEWNIYRKIRNDLTHTYPEEKEALLEAINEAVAIIPRLEETYQKIRRFCQEKLNNG
ncbi:MAG: hypothetical protein QX199_14330 [Methylococcaceae bacterium]